MGRVTKMLQPWDYLTSRSCEFCRKIPEFTPRSVSGWMRSKHFSLSSVQQHLSPDPAKSRESSHGDKRLVQTPWPGLSCLLWQLALTIICGNWFQFPCLSTHSWTFRRKSHSKNIDLSESQREGSTKGHSKGKESCWEKLRGACSGFQERDAQAEGSLEQQGQGSG